MVRHWENFLFISASTLVLGLFLYTVQGRLFYPYDLEWMEGGMLVHAQRIQQGKGLYVQPSSEFIPFIYPPLYAEVLADVGEFFALDYWLGRGISVLATLATCVASIWLLRLEGLSWGLAIVGGALFLEGYEDCGTFYDLTRADAAMLSCVAWSALFLRLKRYPFSGLLLWMAFLFKHNAAIFGIPFALWLWKTENWKSALLFGLWSAIPALMSVGYLQWSTEGYFLTYLLEVPSHHPMVGDRLLWLSEYEMWHANGILLSLMWLGYSRHLWKEGAQKSAIALLLSFLMAAAMTQISEKGYPPLLQIPGAERIPFAILLWIIFASAFLRRNWFNQLTMHQQFWMGCTLTAVVFSAIMRGHHGGYTNVLMPGIWALSLVCVLWLAQQKWPRWLIAGLICLQFWWGQWDPSKYIPTNADKLEGDRLVALLEKEAGPIWIPHSPWLAVQAGHQPYTHLISLWDIDHPEGPLLQYVQDLRKDIQNHHFQTIVSANTQLRFDVVRFYQKQQSIRPAGQLFLPKVGWPVRPSYLYKPKKVID